MNEFLGKYGPMSGICSAHRYGEDKNCRLCYGGSSNVEEMSIDELRAVVTNIEAQYPNLVGREPECCNWFEEDDLSDDEVNAAIRRDDALWLMGEVPYGI